MNFETIILKNCLEDKIYFNKIKTIIEPNIFENPSNSKILELIKDHYNNYNETPSLTELAIKIKDVPNQELRSQIAQSLIDIKNSDNINKEFLLDNTVKFIKNQIFTQAMIAGADFIDKKDEKYKIKSKELMEKASKISINDELGFDFMNIQDRIEYYQNPEKGILYERFKELNKRLGEGFLPGTLNLFLAPSGIGKSLLLSTSIVDFINQGKNVLLVSLEMSENQFLKRIDSDFLDLPINDLKDIDKSVILNKFDEKSKNIGKLYVNAYPAGTFGVSNLEVLIDMYRAHEIEFDIILLDYLGIMRSDRLPANAPLYEKGKAIAEEVRAFAVKYDKIVMSCNQLNRGATNNKSAANDNVSDSMGTVHTADWMCFLLQDEQMKEQSKLLFKITKNRYNGRTDSFVMNVDYNKMRISDEYIPNSIEEKEKFDLLVNKEISELESEKYKLEKIQEINNQSLNW